MKSSRFSFGDRRQLYTIGKENILEKRRQKKCLPSSPYHRLILILLLLLLLIAAIVVPTTLLTLNKATSISTSMNFFLLTNKIDDD